MASSTYSLKADSNKNGERLIFFTFTYDGKRLRKSAEISVKPADWDKRNQRVKSTYNDPSVSNPSLNQLFNTSKSINRTLERMDEDYKAAYHYLQSVRQTITNKTLHNWVEKQKSPASIGKVTLIKFIEDFIQKNKDAKIKKSSTLRTFGNGLKSIKAYRDRVDKDLDFDSIDMDFYKQYIRFMQCKEMNIEGRTGIKRIEGLNLSKNYSGKCLSMLRMFMNRATADGFNVNLKYRDTEFKTFSEKVDAPYLSEAEIKMVYDLDLSKRPKAEAVRDLFVFACFTGLRYSDYSKLTNDNIQGDWLVVTQQKTGTQVDIPILPMARAILDKYKGRTTNSLPKTISSQKFNEKLKDLGEEAKLNEPYVRYMTKGGVRVADEGLKWEFLSSHVCRRSFATNMYLRDIDPIDIMAITGHTTQASFMKYIKMNPRERGENLRRKFLATEPKLKIA
jgi:integrase